MDRFLKRPASPGTSARDLLPVPKRPKPSARQGDIFTAFRAQQFSSTRYAGGDKMLGRICDVAVGHHGLFFVKRNLDSKV